MGIKQITTDVAGQIDVNPRYVRIISTDNLSTVTTAGYLNPISLEGFVIFPTDIVDMWYGYVSNANTGTLGRFTPTIANGVITLNAWENPGNVLLPVVSNDFANFNGTTGQIKDSGYSPSDATKTKVVMAGSAVVANMIAHFIDTAGTIDDTAANVTNLGNISAGASGTAGNLISFPGTAANGSLIVSALNAGGAFNTTIRNSVMGQSSVISIPDPGAATANFIISALTGAGVQHITSGGLQVDGGSLLAGLAAGGTAGSLTLFSPTAANGSLRLLAANAGADFDMTISNTTLGQDSSVVIVDPGNANARFLVAATATPFTSGNFPVASGTGGLMVDSGLAASNIQNKTNIIANSTADIGGGGAGPISVVVAGLTAASKIVATIASSTNTVAVAKCIATATGFDITFTADPGAACVVNYVAFIAAQ